MTVSWLLLADFANVDAAGKLNIIGEFSNLRVDALPCTHTHMSIVAKMCFSPAEAGRTVNVEIKLTDQDGAIVLAAGPLQIGIPNQQPTPRIIEIPFVINIQNLEFTKAGPYGLSFLVNEDEKASRTIEVFLAKGA